MKTPAELATSRLDSPESHKKRATSARRLAGSLRNAIFGAETAGLTEKETKALSEAAGILERLGKAYDGAKLIAARRLSYDEKREKAVRVEMARNFGALATVEDKVAFLAAMNQTRFLQECRNLKDLDYWVKDAFDTLVYRFATQSQDRDLAAVVAEKWAKFEEAKIGLQAQYRSSITRLTSSMTGTESPDINREANP